MKISGAVLFIIGCIVLGAGAAIDTTVPTDFGGRRIHNIGLMNDKQNTLLVGAALLIAGAIFVGFSGRSSASATESHSTKRCPYCAETIKLDAIVCRFCSRELDAQDPGLVEVDKGLGHDELMARYGITCDGKMYHYERYCYSRLEDAVAYAQKHENV